MWPWVDQRSQGSASGVPTIPGGAPQAPSQFPGMCFGLSRDPRKSVSGFPRSQGSALCFSTAGGDVPLSSPRFQEKRFWASPTIPGKVLGPPPRPQEKCFGCRHDPLGSASGPFMIPLQVPRAHPRSQRKCFGFPNGPRVVALGFPNPLGRRLGLTQRSMGSVSASPTPGKAPRATRHPR